MKNFWEDIIKPILRVYQVDVRDRARSTCSIIKRASKPVRTIIQASTGAGKSVIGLDLMLCAYEKEKTSLFIVSGRALVNQFERYLSGANVPFGVIMSGRGRNGAPVQIASKETLTARAIRKNKMDLPGADLVIVDECHESMAPEWRKLLERYSDSVVIGLSATPAFGNGKGLGAFWNGLECAVSTKKLVEEGWLVPCRVFAPDKPDLSGIRLDKDGEYNKIQLAERMDRPKITGNVLVNWKKYAGDRPTVVFGCTIAHAKHLCDDFNAAGIRFRHIDEKTLDDEREEIFGLIRDGKIKGFTNVGVARRGLDLPCLACACVVRPTRSLVLWLQMIGRIRRPSEGKTDSIVIDHAGACDMHCMPDDEIEWSLDAKRKIGDWLERKKAEGKIEKSHTCPQCLCVFTGPRCPSCGYALREIPKETREIEHADGILVERTQSNKGHAYEDLQKGWNRAVAIAVARNVKIAAAIHIFQPEFGMLPWEVKPQMANMPPRKKDIWQKPARELFPNFLRVKVT